MTANVSGPPCDRYWEQINNLLDGELDDQARADVLAHLAECPACERALADLGQLTRTAAALPPRTPRADAWDTIAAALQRELPQPVPTSRRSAPTRWSVLAAAAMLVIAVGSTVWLVRRPAPIPSAPVAASPAAPAVAPASAPGAVNPSTPDAVRSIDEELRAAELHYERAIAGLEQIATSEERQLDPVLAATLKKNMGVIDQAIRDSRSALKTQPTSEVAQGSLFEALQRKVSLLEDTIALINVMRKGDQAATARIVQGVSKS